MVCCFSAHFSLRHFVFKLQLLDKMSHFDVAHRFRREGDSINQFKLILEFLVISPILCSPQKIKLVITIILDRHL